MLGVTAPTAGTASDAVVHRQAAMLARTPYALLLLRGRTVDVRWKRLRFPLQLESALDALADELRAGVFRPLRGASSVAELEATWTKVREPFRQLWGALLHTVLAGLELSPDSAHAVAEALGPTPSVLADLWTSRRAKSRLGEASLPWWAAALDARMQSALAIARWPTPTLPMLPPGKESELVGRAVEADMAIMLAIDVLAERRAHRLAPEVSTSLAQAAHRNARWVFAALTTPLYAAAEQARGEA